MTRAALQAVLNLRHTEKLEKLAKLGTAELERRGRELAAASARAVRGLYDDGTAACIDADLADTRKAWRMARRAEAAVQS